MIAFFDWDVPIATPVHSDSPKSTGRARKGREETFIGSHHNNGNMPLVKQSYPPKFPQQLLQEPKSAIIT